MAVKTLLAAGLTAVAVAGGATWGYVHYHDIFGGGSGCGTSECAPAACSASTECPSSEFSCEASTGSSCCDAPSRADVLAQDQE